MKTACDRQTLPAALGGNALIRPGQRGVAPERFASLGRHRVEAAAAGEAGTEIVT